eukprot:m.266057 g.266057  ORF g.266057 m.266057 type:complete len:216 (+) comp65193_c0_seq1:95-742(+)
MWHPTLTMKTISICVFVHVALMIGMSESKSACPTRSQVQNVSVATEYNVTLAQGKFFELFYEDIVENDCTCFYKHRKIDSVTKSLHDTDRIYCGAMGFYSWYNTTELNYFVPGENAVYDLVMQSPIINKVHFPNWVLGYSKNRWSDGGYVWVVEYQCMQVAGINTYTGFNIYHRQWDPPAEDIDLIKQVIIYAGLGGDWSNIKPMGGPHCNYTQN